MKKIKALLVGLAATGVIVACIQLVGCQSSKVVYKELATAPLPPTKPFPDKTETVLVLSGGGSKSAAHLGVLKGLEAQAIQVDAIVGLSGGALIGALYANRPEADFWITEIEHSPLSNWLRWEWLQIPLLGATNTAVVNEKRFVKTLQSYLGPDQNFEALPLPLAVVTTDVTTTTPQVFTSGPVSPTVHASSAIPLAFRPVELYGLTLMDGGIVSPIPVDIAKALGGKRIIVSDVNTLPSIPKHPTALQWSWHSTYLLYCAFSEEAAQTADWIIKPATKDLSLLGDQSFSELVELGEAAVMASLPNSPFANQD